MSATMDATRTVGVGVIVRKAGRLLVGKLGPAHGVAYGLWSLPGGRARGRESVAEAALRVAAEVGLRCGPVRGPAMAVPGLAAVTDVLLEAGDDAPENAHLVFWVVVDHLGGDPVVSNRDQMREWRWVYPDWLFKVPGADDQRSEQFQWLPVPMLRRTLGPYFQL